MIGNFIELLAENDLLLLFVIIGVGYLLGHLRVLSFQLGVVAVLFVGMFFGAVDRRLALPDTIYIIGLVLFVYAVGLHSGPGFFASFRKRGLRVNLVAAVLLVGAALLALGLALALGLDGPSAAGLFCGALTNTPALAATVETVTALSSDLPSEAAAVTAAAPVVAYGLAYPFGVLGVILAFFVFQRMYGLAPPDASPAEEDDGAPGILSRTFRVSNPGVFGKTLGSVLSMVPNRAYSLSRIRKGDVVSVVSPEVILEPGDLVVAVGSEQELERAHLLFGERCQEHLEENPSQISFTLAFVSSRAAIGQTIASLDLEHRFGATITRLRRGDVDMVPNPKTVLELGDRVRVVAPKHRLEDTTEFLGDSVKALAETDFLSLSLGVVLGVLAGLVPIPLPGGMSFKLGFAGGPLIVSLILGRLERTGPITWSLPYNANLVLRQVGLVFFLAGIGSRAGFGLGATLSSGGLRLLLGAALVTATLTVATLLVARLYLRLPTAAAMGMMAGLQTQPACLAYANQQVETELPNIWYATVYPLAMVAKILLAQVIVSVLVS